MHFCTLECGVLFLAWTWSLVSSWSPNMPGGMKLTLGDRILSFTTDICPGGVFFKYPVYTPLVCSHGYFFRRSNGCEMNGSDIIGAADYTCERMSGNSSKLIQAIIPVTNPESPLDHTITLFDDPDSLSNYRRFTYVKGLERRYKNHYMGAAGAVLVNPRPTPPISIGDLCYRGRPDAIDGAFIAPISIKDSKNVFTRGCDSKQTANIPWNQAYYFEYSDGYSAPEMFTGEIKAKLRGEILPGTSLANLEIWDGLAYCLQEKASLTQNKLGGLYPSIPMLKSHCGQKMMAVEWTPKENLKIMTKSRKKRYSGPHIPCLLRCLRAVLGPFENDYKGRK